MADQGQRHWQTYLNDHLASLYGGELTARRVADENAGTPLAELLVALASRLAEEQELADELLTAAGGSPSAIKQAAVWIAEKLGRLKPNDRLVGYSDLSRVLELEMLGMLCEMRVRFWSLLMDPPGNLAAAGDAERRRDLATADQLQLAAHFTQAAARAFGPDAR